MQGPYRIFTLFFFFVYSLSSVVTAQTIPIRSGYAPVNGLKMYYEIHGSDSLAAPLVLIHGGGSTIITSFGRVLDLFADHRTVIAVELQGHGHTPEIDRPETFQNDADDVAALMHFLKVKKADFFGFSNGGSTALQIAIRHPEIVRKLVVASAMFKRDGMYSWFWDAMKNTSLDNMPRQLKEAYLAVAPNPNDLVKMFDDDAKRMQSFQDWPALDIQSILAPTFIIVGDQDVVRPEHAVEMFHLLPHGRLAILPGAHGECIGEIVSANRGSILPRMTAEMIEEFLTTPDSN